MKKKKFYFAKQMEILMEIVAREAAV